MHNASRITCLMLLYTMMVGNCLATGTRGDVDYGFMPEAEVALLSTTINKIPPFSLFSSGADADGYGTLYFRKGTGSGSFSQYIPAGSSVEIEGNGTTFSGATTVDTDIQFENVSLGTKYYKYLNEKIDAVLGIGIGGLSQDLTATDGVQTAEYTRHNFEMFITFGLGYKLNSWLYIEAESNVNTQVVHTLFPFFDRNYKTYLTDSFLRLTAVQNNWVRYHLGYRMMDYTYTNPDRNNDPREMHIKYSGIYAGVSLQI